MMPSPDDMVEMYADRLTEQLKLRDKTIPALELAASMLEESPPGTSERLVAMQLRELIAEARATL